MSRLTRILLTLIAILAGIVLILAVAGVVIVRRSFPKVNGEVRLTGLDAPVDIYRDSFGIPHIYAQTSHDLFFAHGYIHAQDRFWQMDFWRHVSAGRLAEMFGKDQVDTDKFLRTLGFARIAQEELAQSDPEVRAILEAYAEGVNTYLADHSGSALSLEYTILRLINPDYQVEPWDPVDTLTFAKLMAWDLGSGELDLTIDRGLLVELLGPERMEALYPPYPEDHPVIVNHPHLTATTYPPGEASLDTLVGLQPELDALHRQLASLQPLLGATGDGIGSNSWAISGQLTETGMPLLANDPHLGTQMPSIWSEVGLHCTPIGSECPFDLVGFSFASAPGVVIGHNDRITWGFTNLAPDVMDLYIERINPANPDEYEVNGEWVDMELIQETIQVAGGEPVPLTVRHTRHGPIISDTYPPLEGYIDSAGVDVPGNYALALRWTALEPGNTLASILGFNRAQNWEEFREAASEFVVPSQNLIYADIEGNIGYQAPGLIPIRNPGHSRAVPVPGWTDEYEWQGYIPFEDLPFAFNPPEGYIVTANNAVVGAEYPYTLAPGWDYGFRAARIVEMIQGQGGPIDQLYVQTMQADDKDLNAENLVAVLMEISLDDERLASARAILSGWDYQSGMESAPAALFQAFWKQLLAATFHDELPEDFWPGGGSQWIEVVHGLVEQPNDPWWDDQTTPGIEGRDQIFQRAFAAAVDELEATMGNDPGDWTWGDLHTTTFRNQSLGVSGIAPIEALFNRGPYRTSGGSSIVDATSWNARETYEVGSLPSMRMIVDLEDLSRSLAIHTTGQSGHSYHPHYADMADLWRNGQYHAMLWEQAAIKAVAEGHLRLAP